MCRPYESAVHRPCTPHSVPLTLQVIVSDVYQQIAKRVAAERVAGAGRGTRPSNPSAIIPRSRPDMLGLWPNALMTRLPTTGSDQPSSRAATSAGNPPVAIGPERVGVIRISDLSWMRMASRYASQSGCSPEMQRK
jgi:hypothetical protein